MVAEVLGGHYYSHSKLNTLFMEAGAPGEPPLGNCVDKCVFWLKRVNEEDAVDPLKVLGGVLFQFMEASSGPFNQGQIGAGQERIRSVLGRCGLAYHESGVVLAGGAALPVASLNGALRQRDLPALELEFKRALDTLETDPPAAVTAACSILESLFKLILEDEGKPLPQKETVKPLWAAVQDHLGLNPAKGARKNNFTDWVRGCSSISGGHRRVGGEAREAVSEWAQRRSNSDGGRDEQ